MAKKGRSEKKKDWLGREYIQHYDAQDNKSGRSERKETFFGEKYTQHYDAADNKRGKSESNETWLGRQYTQKYDSKGEKSGTRQKKTTWLGQTYMQHYDSSGNETDRSEYKQTLFGKKYVERYGNERRVRENQGRTSVLSETRNQSTSDYRPARHELSRFCAIAFGGIAGFIFIKVAGPAATGLITARNLYIVGRLGWLPIVWLYAVGTLVGLTVTAMLSGKRERAGTAAVSAIVLTVALALLMTVDRRPISKRGSGLHTRRTQHVEARQATLPAFHVTVNYDQTMIEMVAAGKYNWKQADWIYEVGRDPLFTRRHGATEVEIVLVHFNREMRSDEAIRELKKMNLRPIEVAELLAFGAAYPEKQVEYPIVALGSMYQGWSPSLDNYQMPILTMVGRGLSLGGNRNGGDMWESNSRFGAVR
jgi:hypothetical protein